MSSCRRARSDGKSIRAVLYDTMSDKYSPVPARRIPARGVCEVQHPEGRVQPGDPGTVVGRHRRVHRRVESSRRVQPRVHRRRELRRDRMEAGEIDGGNVYPFKGSRTEGNLRVWMNDGSEDQETNPGSWPLQNIQLANSLKMKGYDFNFSFGHGTHHAAQAASDCPSASHGCGATTIRRRRNRSSSRAPRKNRSRCFASEFTIGEATIRDNRRQPHGFSSAFLDSVLPRENQRHIVRQRGQTD